MTMKRDTRTALMDFAEYAARSRGFDGFSYADMAKAVGIRKASIHHYFPTKANLSEALIERYQTNLQCSLAEMDAAHATGGERLKALIDLYRAALNDGHTVCLCVAFSTSRESLSEAVIDRVGAVRETMLRWIAATFKLGQRDGSISAVNNPVLEAHATLAMLEGAHLSARIEEDPAAFDLVTDLLSTRCQ
jgi:TetR/AcrR family transcriptional repressor of nem operon